MHSSVMILTGLTYAALFGIKKHNSSTPGVVSRDFFKGLYFLLFVRFRSPQVPVCPFCSAPLKALPTRDEFCPPFFISVGNVGINTPLALPYSGRVPSRIG